MTDVVSNTSPLSYLHKLRHLDVLRRLFGTILVPTAVAIELRIGLLIAGKNPRALLEVA